MKDRKVIAMLITSIVAFVASLTISLGVTSALADPVAAIGLAEISYTVSTSQNVSKEIVFDPVSAYNEDIVDGVLVHNYDDIQYGNELLPDNIKLLKVAVTNDTAVRARFNFNITVDGNEGTEKFIQVAIFDVANPLKPIKMRNGEFEQMTIEPNSVAHYIIAGYVNTQYDFLNEVTFGSNMTMTVSITHQQ